jgi:hypothetical protein
MGKSTFVINRFPFDCWPLRLKCTYPNHPFRCFGIPPDQLNPTRPSSMAYIPHTTIRGVSSFLCTLLVAFFYSPNSIWLMTVRVIKVHGTIPHHASQRVATLSNSQSARVRRRHIYDCVSSIKSLSERSRLSTDRLAVLVI